MELSNNFNGVEIAGKFLGSQHFLMDQFMFTSKHSAKKNKIMETFQQFKNSRKGC